MTPTRIEERAARAVHNKAFDAARARGADFHCATMVGFSATDDKPVAREVCQKCRRLGIDELLTNSTVGGQ